MSRRFWGRYSWVCVLLFWHTAALNAQPDTLHVNDFLAQVARNHPLARVANGYTELRDGELLTTRAQWQHQRKNL
jgi:hypothetical protein